MTSLIRTNVRAQRCILAMWDVASWFIATLVLAAARYDFQLSAVQWQATLLYPFAVSAAQLTAAWWMKLYRGHSRVGSFEEASALTGLVMSISIVIGAFFLGFIPEFPRGVALTVPLGALAGMATGRFVARAYLTRASRRRVSPASERVLVYGAGNAGRELGRLLLFDVDAPYSVVGYIDDNPHNQNLHLSAGRVLGTRRDLIRLASENDVHTLILAIPSAPSSFRATWSTRSRPLVSSCSCSRTSARSWAAR